MKIAQWQKHHPSVKDRKRHPWIRLYLDDTRLFLLTDEQRGQLVAMMLAADAEGELPNNPQVLAKLCRMDSEPNLQVFEELGFLEGVPKVYTECTQNANKTVTEWENSEQINGAPSRAPARLVTSNTYIASNKGNGDKPQLESQTHNKEEGSDIFDVTNNTLDSDSESLSVEESKIHHLPASTLPKQARLLLDAYNAVAEEINLPVCRKLTAARRAAAQARLKEHGPQGMALALEQLRQSKFCQGDNDRGWRANIDFVLQQSSCAKLIEGTYSTHERKSNMQKAMELIDDAANGPDDGWTNSAAVSPVLPQLGEVGPTGTGYSNSPTNNVIDWPEHADRE